ncbi:hypothetical protein BKA70DRAFT_1094838 [Coprinopsis sp. MPI-PUGE-AT-0042]|nr:hypothetical protein BKA70DRAFT_1094838 [Coprinopsis sp. MPI-PUGE-AT-0042]
MNGFSNAPIDLRQYGTQPGALDPSQRARILRHPNATLLFATHDPKTAGGEGEVINMARLTLDEHGFSKPRRVVLEIFPNGNCSWKFIPKARLEGVTDEGLWPRVIELFNVQLVNCPQEQWEIYKLDPNYDCVVRAYPSMTCISPKTPEKPEVENAGRKRTRSNNGDISPSEGPSKKPHIMMMSVSDLNSDNEEDEVAQMITDEHYTKPAPGKRFKPHQNNRATKRARARVQEESSDEEAISPNTLRPRRPKKRDREGEKKKRWEEYNVAKSIARERQVLADLIAAAAEAKKHASFDGGSSASSSQTFVDPEEAAREAAIAESRRKLQELEADRPMWDAAAKERAAHEQAEEESKRRKAEAKQRAEDERRRVEQEKQRRQQREEEERQRKEAQEREEARARASREREARRARWNSGGWSSRRAVERFMENNDYFDITRFSETNPLAVEDIPWPTLLHPSQFSPEDVDWSSVEEFFDVLKTYYRTQEYASVVEKSHRRFHPDRWRSRNLFKAILDASERDFVEVGGPSSSATLDNVLHPLASLTATSGLEGVASTTSILPTSRSTEDASTLKASGSNLNSNSNFMEGSSATVTNAPPVPPSPPPPATPTTPTPPRPQTGGTSNNNNGTLVQRLFGFLGYGNNASQSRKTQVQVVQHVAWGITQVTTIVVLVSLSGTIWKSPVMPNRTEWEACDRPLGIWACLWAGRAILVTGLEYWDYKRGQARYSQATAESGGTPAAAPGTPHVPATGGLFPQPPTNPYEANNDQNANEPPINLPYTLLYSRLTLFCSLITLSWFLTAHILEYTSLSTCRHAAPHLWWLVFGCLCIMYLMLLEVVVLGFIVLIVAPILFIFWNILLLCIGRRPAQNPHMIKPDVGKLSKSNVDRLPLVMYIPPPPTSSSDTTPESAAAAPPHQYPPAPQKEQTQASAVAEPAKRSRRFRFFKRKPKSIDEEGEGNAGAANVDPEKGDSWEDQYEKGEHPFVVLEGNRAACAICLMDFEPPKRKDEAAGGEASVPTSPPAAAPSRSTSGLDPEQLRLEDSGEGAQPLRLLACGHVFHQTCIDPWLTDVSGRCPVCQRKVEEADLLKKKKRRQR